MKVELDLTENEVNHLIETLCKNLYVRKELIDSYEQDLTPQIRRRVR